MTAAPLEVALVNPLQSQGWNETLARCPGSTIFHSANWARLLADCYGYHPSYLALTQAGSFRGCLPVMEVDSLFTGRRGVCLCFADYCGALVREPDDFRLLLERILELGRTSGWRSLEFRGEQLLGGEQPARVYAHHLLELSRDEGRMQARLRESTARNIRKAQKEGVAVRICDTLEGVRQFYRLHCLTRKRHGVPPQSIRFFEKLHQHVISQGLGFTALASHGADTVAGVICLHFGANALYKYGASDESYQLLRANNLVLWEAIRKCAREGFLSFSLGRTDLDNEGLLAFKNGWGGDRSDLNYYRYEFGSKRFVRDREQNLEPYRKVFRKLPINLLRMIGTVAYRHLG